MSTPPYPDTLPQLLRAQAEAAPARAGFVVKNAARGRQSLTWGLLWGDVQRIARVFQRNGLSRGDRLAILLPPCAQWELAHQAGLLLGLVIVGVEYPAADERLEFVLTDCDVAAILLDRQETWDRIPPRVRQRIRFAVAIHTPSRVDDSAPLMSWSELTQTEPSDEQWITEPTADDPATLIYTSGTTGTPKAIEFSHRQLLVACMSILDAFPELQPGDRTLCWLPMSHLFQRMVNLIAIARGLTIHFTDDPQKIMLHLEEAKPSFFAAVPRFFEKLADQLHENPEQRHDWFSSVKIAVTGSAPMPPRLLEFLHDRGLLVLEAYGLSENAVPIAVNRTGAFRFGSVGKVLATNEVRLTDDGEILVRGPGVFHGYRGTGGPSEGFTDDGFFHTGDCGHFDREGFLYLTGRKSDMIKTSTGCRVAPARLEAIYGRCPLVEQVVIVGNGRKYLSALVTLNVPAVQESIERCGRSLPAGTQLSRSPEVKRLVEECLAGLGNGLASHERPVAVALLPRPLSVSEGELTSAHKLRRAQIERNYSEIIDSLYQWTDVKPGSDMRSACSGKRKPS